MRQVCHWGVGVGMAAAAACDAILPHAAYAAKPPYAAVHLSGGAKAAKTPASLPELLGDSVKAAAEAWELGKPHHAIVQRGQQWLQITTARHGDQVIASEADVSKLIQERDHKDVRFRRVCHDLRTPLHGIVGLAEDLMFKAKRAGSDPRSAEAIMHEGQRLSFMINDILDSSKLKAGKMQINRVPITAHKEVEKVIMSLRQARDHSSGHALLADDVVLRNDMNPLHPAIEADEHRLSQILFNLVGNACKFTEKGTVKVHDSRVEEGGVSFLAIHVEDTGMGIPDETIPTLFQEYAQADNRESRQFAGTGLGLAICRELVELHGGRIWVESRAGKGSTFSFTMPVSAKGLPAEDAAAAVEEVPWEVGDGTLDELFGASGAFGTGSFRYGTGGLASGRYDRWVSLMKRLTNTKSLQLKKKTAREDMWLMGDAALADHIQQNYRWFVGAMDRAQAATLLEPFPVGSFLVRQGSKGFVFSVRYTRAGGNQEMLFNVEIYTAQEPDDTGRVRSKYYVAESTRFDDLPTLVEYYVQHPAIFFGNLADGAEYQGQQLHAPFSVAEEQFY
mmetsp:Transcript_21237/g.55414  ORF Transcript_21237/g.55414 Transcript_21237/m.55414 type:complete len:563 (+) Transcript_21237:2-1690(+)